MSSAASDRLHELARDGAGGRPAAPPAAPEPPRRWLRRLALPGAVAAGVLGLFASALVSAFAPVTPVYVAAAAPGFVDGSRPGTSVVQAAGWLEADPFPVAVSALADGIVEEVLVLEGDRVEAGAPVARLIDRDARLELARAEAQLQEKEAALAEAEAELRAAQTVWDNPVELIRAVDVAEAQVRESRATIEQIRAEIAAEKALLEEAEAAHRRAQALVRAHAVAQAELDRARARFRAHEAQVNALERRMETLSAQMQRQQTELDAAGEMLRLRTDDRRARERAEASVRRAEAEVANALALVEEKALQLERMTVRAPAPGIVLRRLIQPGTKLVRSSDDPASAYTVYLYDPERMQVRVDVPLADAALVGVGQAAEIMTDVLPGVTLDGMVTRVTHEADIQKNTLEAKVAVLSPRPELRPEMLVRVRFLGNPNVETDGIEQRSVFIPADAVRDSAGEPHVWTVTGYDGYSGRAARRAIPAERIEQDGWVDIGGSLAPGALVIVEAEGALKEGRRVRVLGERADT